MHSRTAWNAVLFSQFQEHGLSCEWTGLKKMAINELLTVCTSTKDVNKFQEGFDLLFQGKIECCELLADYLVLKACPTLSFNAVNAKKCHLLFGLFKEHGLETFTTPPSFSEATHEILNICEENNCDVNQVTKELFEKIVKAYKVQKPHDEYHAVISYLTEYEGVDVNDLTVIQFTELMDYLQNILLYLCSGFSTLTTNIFLHAELDASHFHLLWVGILKHLPANMYPGSVDLIRSFIKRGCDVKEAIFRVDFSHWSVGRRCTPQGFNDLLEIFEIFMDHGARLNPSASNEEPFLRGILKVYSNAFCESENPPKLYEFITKCIRRGVDPKSCVKTAIYGGIHEDLFSAVCDCYFEDDKDQLIEFLCNCGADASLHRNNGLDLWVRLCYPSQDKFLSPRFNETLLILLRRGLRTGWIDQNSNNVLHMYLRLYSYSIYVGELCECCKYGWLRQLDDLKFWDVLDALLNADHVQVSLVNSERKIPFDFFKVIIPRDFLSEGELETVCPKCCQRYMDGNMAVNPEAELMRVRRFIDRLSP